MNCYICGEEIKTTGEYGLVCKECMVEALDATDEHDNTGSNVILSPEEAIKAMLDGEVLDRGHGVVEKWNGRHFVYRILGAKKWLLKPIDGEFVGLRRRSHRNLKLLTPRDAIIALLDGAILKTGNGIEVIYDFSENSFVDKATKQPWYCFRELYLETA